MDLVLAVKPISIFYHSLLQGGVGEITGRLSDYTKYTECVNISQLQFIHRHKSGNE